MTLLLALLLATGTHPEPRSGCWAPSVQPQAPDTDGTGLPARGLASDAAPAGAAGRVLETLAPRIMEAARIPGAPPTIDGRLDDDAWCASPAATDFVQSSPRPGQRSSLHTVVHLVYDDEAVWVGVRAYDPRPDSIVAPFPRRDDETTSDWLFVEIDSRFDRRSARSFGLNPRGVQVDGSWSEDVDYDETWNGVWSGAAEVDSLGWVAEFRIPWSQLPLGHATPGRALTWGINVYRYAPHRGESSNWSPRLPNVVGVVSHFNRAEGLVVPPRRAGLELVPFIAVSGTPPDGARLTSEGGVGAAGAGAGSSMDAGAALGLDARIHPTGGTTLALSVLPDFGQVEADPSQVNLTTFETFLVERRRLFVEGADVFRFPSALAFAARGTSFEEEQPFYSRRVGAPPHGTALPGVTPVNVPRSTDLLAAVRVSGRVGSWSGGALEGWTARESGTFADSTGGDVQAEVEPLTQYFVARAVRELAGARHALGGILTVVDRTGMTPELASVLPRRALVAGADARSRFAGGRYEVTGFALGSRVSGSAPAVHSLRLRSSSTATRLTGLEAQARLARVEGALLWSVTTRLVTPGFESNDAGFQRNADWALAAASWRYQSYRPGHAIRRWSLGSTQLGYGRTLGGLVRAAALDLRADADLASYWGGSVSVRRELPSYDPEVLRGGPPLLLPTRDHAAIRAYSDTRRRWQVTATGTFTREAASSSRGWTLAPETSGFVTDRLQLGLGLALARTREGRQFVAAARDAEGRGRWILGDMIQHTASLTTRATYAFSSHLTAQLYAEAFLSGGAFRRFSEVVAPGEDAPARDVEPIATGRLTRAGDVWTLDSGAHAISFADPAFSERDLNASLVVRWEFRPGSTLFAVWTQSRHDDTVRPFALRPDLSRLGGAPSRDALELKVTWWLAP